MKKQTKVLFFFDCEDFTSERAAEAIKVISDMLVEEGIVGQFAVVGRLAERLKYEWKREDVLAAFDPHVIGVHSYLHSIHPDPMELTDVRDFDEAMANLTAREDNALRALADVFPHKKPLFYACPGNSDTYVAYYYYTQHGIPYMTGTYVYDARRTELACCNADLQHYDVAFEDLIFSGLDVDAEIERLATMDRVNVYTHPNMADYSVFWDEVNFAGGNLHGTDPKDWVEAPRRTPEDTALYYRRMHEIIRKIKNDPRFRITSLAELHADRQPRSTVTRDRLPALLASVRATLGPVDDLSLSDMFHAALAFLKDDALTEYHPGYVYGLLDEPYRLTSHVTLTPEEVREAARTLTFDRFIPASVTVGNKKIGPASFLVAMLETLTGWSRVTLVPRDETPAMTDMPELPTYDFSTEWLHTPEFHDEYLSDRLRRQCWTLRAGNRTVTPPAAPA